MMIDKIEFIERARIDRTTLDVWIEEQWLLPDTATSDPAFTEADLARAALIRELTQELGVNDEGVGVILSLLDQVHGLRRALADVLQSAREWASGTGADATTQRDRNRD